MIAAGDQGKRVSELLRQVDAALSQSAGQEIKQELDELCYPRPPSRGVQILQGDKVSEYSARCDALAWQAGIVPPLRAALSHGGPKAKVYAATCLGLLHDVTVVGCLIGLLSDAEPEVRSAAAGALQYVSDRRALAPLIAAASDPDEGTACKAMWSLGRLGFREALAALIANTRVRAWRRRQAAYHALSWIGRPECVSAAHAGLADSKPQVRKAAKAVLSAAHRCRSDGESLE